jgi:hypothetical protein
VAARCWVVVGFYPSNGVIGSNGAPTNLGKIIPGGNIHAGKEKGKEEETLIQPG